MGATSQMHLPDELRSYREDLAAALVTPRPIVWDEDETYHDAEQPAAIGALLVRVVHTDLVNASIAYIYREKMKTRDRCVWGKASKAGGKLEFFNGFDFVIEINWEQWRHLSEMQRIALVDHELSHCGLEVTDKGERKWVLVSHDIEEFGGIVQRWGLWRHDLTVFAGAVVHAHQLGLFEGTLD